MGFYMKKNSKNKSSNVFPFSDEIKQAKYGFKKMVDEMSDGEFIHFIMLFFDFIEDIDFEDDDFDYMYDEDFECDELPF